jgi:hypothetical protein
MDEYAAVFQSKIFASGGLFAELPAPLVPRLIASGFNGVFLLISPSTGHAIEAYWPGFALLLAPFQLIGVPWLRPTTASRRAIVREQHLAHDTSAFRDRCAPSARRFEPCAPRSDRASEW